MDKVTLWVKNPDGDWDIVEEVLEILMESSNKLILADSEGEILFEIEIEDEDNSSKQSRKLAVQPYRKETHGKSVGFFVFKLTTMDTMENCVRT